MQKPVMRFASAELAKEKGVVFRKALKNQTFVVKTHKV